MLITRAHLLTTNNGAAVLRKKIEYLQLKSVTDTRYGRSVHNASEFYDEIRRDTHSDTRPIRTFDLSETTK